MVGLKINQMSANKDIKKLVSWKEVKEQSIFDSNNINPK